LAWSSEGPAAVAMSAIATFGGVGKGDFWSREAKEVTGIRAKGPGGSKV